MSLIEKKNEKTILKKHINTIHCSNNLTLVQRKLFNALLFNAYHDLPEQSKYQVSIKKLCELIGYDSRDYKKLRKSIMDLITTAIEWNVIDHENGEQQDKWRASAIISAAKIESGVCTYEFSSIMRELLYTPEIYGKIDIKMMVEFKSNYGLALYENCIRFHGISQTQWLSISVFRKLMGVPDKNYQNFCDFKKRVLDIAVKEVNQYSPIIVTPEIKRINKKVTNIRFKISNKKIDSLDEKNSSEINTLNKNLVYILKNEFFLASEVIADIALRYDNDYIENKIHLIKKSYNFKAGKIRELAAYLIDALKKDYQPSKSNHIIVSAKRYEMEQQAIYDREDQAKKIKLENDKQKKAVKKYIDSLSKKRKINLIANFEKYIKEKDSFYLYKKYKEIGMKSPIVRAVFNSFVGEILNKKVISDVCVL